MTSSVHGSSTRRARGSAPTSGRPQAKRAAPAAAARRAARAAPPPKRSAVSRLKTPLVAVGAAAAGLAGGLALGARVLSPGKRVLGVPVGGRKGIDLKPVAREIKRAGQQVGRLNDEIAMAREQAKKVGDALS
jgi:hypothetical protein